MLLGRLSITDDCVLATLVVAKDGCIVVLMAAPLCCWFKITLGATLAVAGAAEVMMFWATSVIWTVLGRDAVTWGDVERTKTVAAAAVVEVMVVEESWVTVVEGMRCWVVTIVGVTWAVGAEVAGIAIGRMLAVGVVVTVGLTAAVGAVDWDGACVDAGTLDTTTCIDIVTCERTV